MANLKNACLSALVLLMALCAYAGSGAEAGRYVEVHDYVADAFPDGAPQAKTLWLTGGLREAVEQALGHRYDGLRLRYWQAGDTTAWVLDEIGKELPITIGVTVCNDAIADVRVLEFRESRGWEVRYPFFTDQFRDARLDGRGQLDRGIDGITGATLSVGAVTRVAKVALLLHDSVSEAS